MFIENVPGLRRAGLRDVLADLAALGFDAEWDCFSAAEVGASHRRNRIFILAYANRKWLRQQSRRAVRKGRKDQAVAADGAGRDVANASGEGELQFEGSQRDQRRRTSDGEPHVGNADGTRLEGRRVHEFGGTDEWPAWPPSPADAMEWEKYLGVHPGTEPALCRGSDGLPDRMGDRLRLLGNACVPEQAALAYRTLIARAIR